MNNDISISLTIYNPSACSYTTAEYVDFHDVYTQALDNPEVIYQIEVDYGFCSQPLFQVINRIDFNIETVHWFDSYEKAVEFKYATKGTLVEIPEAWIVEWIDLTDDTQTDYFIDEYDNYLDAMKEYAFWYNYEQQGLACVKEPRPIFK